jgi:hypothetical protein
MILVPGTRPALAEGAAEEVNELVEFGPPEPQISSSSRKKRLGAPLHRSLGERFLSTSMQGEIPAEAAARIGVTAIRG